MKSNQCITSKQNATLVVDEIPVPTTQQKTNTTTTKKGH